MSLAPPIEELLFREGRSSDRRSAFELGQRAQRHTGRRISIEGAQREPDEEAIEQVWKGRRTLVELLDAQPGSSFWVCEGPEGLVGYARVVRFEGMEQLSELMVEPAHHGHGVGHALLDRCWPEKPTPDLGRLAVAGGSADDLGLYVEFGAMPITGHWHLVHHAEQYLERRHRERDLTEPAVHVLKTDRAVAEWKRLEPPAIGHRRPELHDFFGRERTCLACMDGESGQATALCWVHSGGEIGPGVGEGPAEVVPVVLAALDRVATTQEPEELHIRCTTDSWWLLRRLRGLGFKVWWPSWVMCSVPLPGLDRYVPAHPGLVL
jgi:GNAT superfamily N-acetyltransferase